MPDWSTTLAVLAILAPGLFVSLRHPEGRKESASALDELSLRNGNIHAVLRAAWLFANVSFLWRHTRDLVDPQIRLEYGSMKGGLFSAVVLIVVFGYTTLCLLYLIACRLFASTGAVRTFTSRPLTRSSSSVASHPETPCPASTTSPRSTPSFETGPPP